MRNSNNSGNNSIGFFGLLTIVFITLKLTGYIEWSWFWVLSPLIASASIALVVLIITLMIVKFRK